MSTGRVAEMAQFLVHIGLKPEEYWALKVAERDAIVKEWNAAARRRK